MNVKWLFKVTAYECFAIFSSIYCPNIATSASHTDFFCGGDDSSKFWIKGKSSSRKKGVGTAPGSITLREEIGGNKKKQIHVNAKSMLKLEHIKNLATWVSGEAYSPSLGAFSGQRLAASAESLGVPPGPSLFTCQSCFEEN